MIINVPSNVPNEELISSFIQQEGLDEFLAVTYNILWSSEYVGVPTHNPLRKKFFKCLDKMAELAN